MNRLFRKQTCFQRRMYQFWCLFHQIIFGLNDPHDSILNHTGHLSIGRGCFFSDDVKLITRNHDVLNPSCFLPFQDIVIGDCCWFGENSILLPGVHLGQHTVVAAGAVVTKSFPNGFVVLGGVPARVIRKLEVKT